MLNEQFSRKKPGDNHEGLETLIAVSGDTHTGKGSNGLPFQGFGPCKLVPMSGAISGGSNMYSPGCNPG